LAVALPTIPRDTLADVAARDLGKFAFEGRGERDAADEFNFGGRGGVRCVMRRRRANLTLKQKEISKVILAGIRLSE
jgi:hypothetical protein